jgi:hypothetical protein
MTSRSTVQRLALGVAAGLATTFVVKGLQAVGQNVRPQSMPPLKQDPGEFMVQKAEAQVAPAIRARIPPSVEKAAATSLAFGYGATFGALYAASRPEVESVLSEGTALGLATWAVGYLGWLPATGLMPPITRHSVEQILAAVASHIVFGIVTVGLYSCLRKAV